MRESQLQLLALGWPCLAMVGVWGVNYSMEKPVFAFCCSASQMHFKSKSL